MTDQLPNAAPPSPARPKWGVLRLFNRCVAFTALIAILTPIVLISGMIASGPLAQDKTVIIPHGANATTIGIQLAQEGTIYTAPFFWLAARLIASNTLKAGEYAIPAHASPIDIATMMHEGKSVVRKFTVVEGLTSTAIVQLLDQDPTFTGTIDSTPPEGSLLPETYRYSYGDSRQGMIARMQKAMDEKINTLWASRDPNGIVATPKEAIILASIVEKETGKPEERPRIAGVFYNRLHQNMRLQSDPTVIYALSKGKGELDHALNHDDLSFNSPINTYTNDGLPPQPICNPGYASINAVLHPEHNNLLYFVADGSGGHAFAADLAAHNENINHWHQVLENKNTPHN